MADFSMSPNSTPEQEQQTSSSNILSISIFFSFPTQSTDPNQETNDGSSDQEDMIGLLDHEDMIGLLDQEDMMMMMNPPSLKDGPLPASKASIEAMRNIEITEKDHQELGDKEECCSICLNEWKIGEQVKEMPCKHRYHSNCIEKWLRIHGCCPVCRFKMPEEEINNKQEIGTMVEMELSEEVAMNLLGLLMQSINNHQEH